MNSIMEIICAVCLSVLSHSQQGMVFHEILQDLRKQFRRQSLNLSIKSQRKSDLLPEEFYVNAFYDAVEDSQGLPPIEIIVYHNFSKTIIWDKQQIKELLTEIYDATVHEFRHQRQSQKRNHKTFLSTNTRPYNDYLSDPDEMDAYALSIAIELARILGKSRAIRNLSRIDKLAKMRINGRFVSPILSAYLGQFGSCQHPIIKSLAKKIYIRLEKVDTDSIFQ